VGTGIDIEALKQTVREAGELSLRYYGKVTKELKGDQTLVTEADRGIEAFLKETLRSLQPDYGYIGEETEENREPRNGATCSWIVDALDGTRAFSAQMPLWTPAVCLMDGARPVAGAAINPVTGELFWAGPDGGAYCNDEPLQPDLALELKPNSFIFGPTNHHKSFSVDFPGRVYCLGAPIYQLCLLAKGAVRGLFFDRSINLWDLALPSLLLERVGAELVYASGKPLDLAALMDRSKIPEALYAGGSEMVAMMREKIVPRQSS
jgi:myo-inositol-1(or 4)-monophosphatase